MEQALTNAFLATDLEISRAGIHKSGATAVTALLKCGEGGKRTLYAANAGDARAVLCRANSKDRNCPPVRLAPQLLAPLLVCWSRRRMALLIIGVFNRK